MWVYPLSHRGRDMKLTEAERGNPNLAHLQCVSCHRSDRLYEDAHGVFCSRCGPSYPVRPRAARTALEEQDGR